MSNLLLKISANKLLAFDLRPATLYIFDDHIEFKGNQGVIGGEEVTLTYNQIAEVDVKRGFIQSSFTVVNTGGQDDISMGHLLISDASKAKQLIEQRALQASEKGSVLPNQVAGPAEMQELNKLLEQGIITGAEYEQRKNQLAAQGLQSPSANSYVPSNPQAPTPPPAPPTS